MIHAEPVLLPFKGKTPVIDPTAYIAPGAVLVGDVTIGPHASVWFGSVLRGDDHSIRVEEGANIQDGSVIHVTLETGPTLVGKNVVVGHGARLHGCTLGEGCLIGIGAIILDHVTVEPGAFVAAGALVAPGKKIPGGELWAGNPARKLRDLRQSDKDFMIFDVAHYKGLTEIYRDQQVRAQQVED